jgi:AAA domain-containing protein
VNVSTTPAPFPVVRPSELRTAAASSAPWLIDQLWTAHAVGIIGGTPKSYKTWMALEIAVSVASGSACLTTFAVPSPGPVLLYAAEDSEATLRLRLESLVQHHGLALAQLDLRVITADSLRLDRTSDQERLEATLLLHRPVLLILDPLVRLHAIDENAAGEIAALLGYLRLLQRKSGAAIALVHHARKNVSASGGAGYSLRGSSDLYAWVDSFLYLRRHHSQLQLSAEHRSAPGAGPMALELAMSESGPYLQLTSAANAVALAQGDPLLEQILALLSRSSEPCTAENLRSRLQVRNQRLVEALRQLCEQGKAVRLPQGYVRPHNSALPLMIESSSPRVAPR